MKTSTAAIFGSFSVMVFACGLTVTSLQRDALRKSRAEVAQLSRTVMTMRQGYEGAVRQAYELERQTYNQTVVEYFCNGVLCGRVTQNMAPDLDREMGKMAGIAIWMKEHKLDPFLGPVYSEIIKNTPKTDTNGLVIGATNYHTLESPPKK